MIICQRRSVLLLSGLSDVIVPCVSARTTISLTFFCALERVTSLSKSAGEIERQRTGKCPVTRTFRVNRLASSGRAGGRFRKGVLQFLILRFLILR